MEGSSDFFLKASEFVERKFREQSRFLRLEGT